MKVVAKCSDIVEAQLISNPSILFKAKIGSIWDWEHWRDGKLIDQWREGNICTAEGLNALLNIMFHAATQLTTWYVLIFETDTTPADGTTYATPVWTESTAYDEATRPEYVEAAASAKNITNSASKAVFTISATKTIYGAALVGGQTVVTGPIASFADYGATVAGTVLATDVGHGRATGDVVAISATTNYNGTYVITVVSVDTFYFTATWVATETGTWTLRSSQKKGDAAGGGTMFCASKFAASKSVVDNDILNCTIGITVADT